MHDVAMARTPIHVRAGQVGVANPALLLGVDTASDMQLMAGVGVVGSAVVAVALQVLSGDASILDASSSQARRLDP